MKKIKPKPKKVSENTENDMKQLKKNLEVTLQTKEKKLINIINKQNDIIKDLLETL